MIFSWKTFIFKKINKKIISLVALCLLLLFFHTRGLFNSDEGYILSAAQRVYDGQIPYKDFTFVYTPLTIYLDALALKFFGLSIFATRLMAVCLSVATVLLLLQIFRMITKKTYLQFAGVLLFLSWGPTHANFIFPTQLAISTAILTCFLLLRGMQKKQYELLFFAGVTTLLVFLSKQNFGVAMIPVIGTFFLFTTINKREGLKQYIKGFLFSVALFFLLLLFSGSLAGFLQNFYSFSIQHILKEGAFSTQFFYEASFYGLFKSFFYLTPLLISILAAIICFKKNRNLLFLPAFVFFFYITGIRPTTDYIHLTPLLALSCLSFILTLEKVKKIWLKIFLHIFLIILIILGFYTALYKNYYRWHTPLIQNNYFDTHPRIQIFTPHNTISKLTTDITTQSKPNEYIFVTYYAPMLYFTTGRKNPTKFDLFEEFPYYVDFKQEVIQDLERTKTKLIITFEKAPTGFLADYIKKHYRLTSRNDEPYIWKRIN